MEKHYYFCNTDGHTRQVLTTEDSPRCPTCNGVMTYGRFTEKFSDGLILKPGPHKLITGETVILPMGIVAQ